MAQKTSIIIKVGNVKSASQRVPTLVSQSTVGPGNGAVQEENEIGRASCRERV